MTVKEYGHSLAGDPAYAAKAARVGALTRDLSEFVPALLPALRPLIQPGKIRHLAYHPPCTLQHGQQLRGGVERVLSDLGFKVELARGESHLCCGAAGTYAVLEADLAGQLRDRKLSQLEAVRAECIVSANVGCIHHLQTGTSTPVRHWIEVLDEALTPR
jgi:glycolate oxidase iron-sulfur subunit